GQKHSATYCLVGSSGMPTNGRRAPPPAKVGETLRNRSHCQRLRAGRLVEMSRSYGVLLCGLAAVWGASYFFIKVADRDLEPTVMMAARMLLAALLLAAFLAVRDGTGVLRDVVGAWKPGLIMGVINGALPFTLIAWGEKHIDSGVAAIANATV